MRLIALAAATAMTLAGCGSSNDPSPPVSAESPSGGPEQRSQLQERADHGAGKGTKNGGKASRQAPKDGAGRGPAAQANNAQDGGGAGPPGARTGPGGANAAPRARARMALYPAPGTYAYSQSGFEQFCTTSCEREALPKTQRVSNSVKSRSRRSAVIVSEAQASSNRVMRTTSTFARNGARVTEVYVRFAYRGFTFTNTYRPQPPVESLRFPLRPGDRWSGEWRARVSGDYRVAVEGYETVMAGNRRVKAAKLDTTTHFRGEFEGSAHITIWLDPETKAVVQTAGNLDVKSAFGRYVTGFQTRLSSGPGY